MKTTKSAATSLLAALRAQGLRLWLEDGHLRVAGPSAAFTAGAEQSITTFKEELVDAVAAETEIETWYLFPDPEQGETQLDVGLIAAYLGKLGLHFLPVDDEEGIPVQGPAALLSDEGRLWLRRHARAIHAWLWAHGRRVQSTSRQRSNPGRVDAP